MQPTLPCKHDSTVTKMADRYKTTITTPHGPRRCFEVTVEREGRTPLIARFGGIPLRRKRNAVLTDRTPARSTADARSWSPGFWPDAASCASRRTPR